VWLVVKASESICGRVRGVLGGILIVAFAIDSNGRVSPRALYQSRLALLHAIESSNRVCNKNIFRLPSGLFCM